MEVSGERAKGHVAACQRGRWMGAPLDKLADGGAPCTSAICHVLRPADRHTTAKRQRQQSGPASERGMRAGMEDEEVRDVPRSRGLPGMPSWEGCDACA